MAVTIGGKAIPHLDTLTDQEVVSILDSVFVIAKSTARMDRERETFDFKLVYPPADNHEIRKDFASFANTTGGLIIVGVDNNGGVRGVTSPPSDTHLRQVLSEGNRIKPPADYLYRQINYNGFDLVVYQIFESLIPVEVYSHNRWRTFRRFGSTTGEMTRVEVMLKWYRGVRQVPDYHRLQLDSVAFYSPSGAVLGKYVEWKTLNPENLYRMLKLPYLPAVFVPTSTSILSSSELYYNTTRWHGDMKSLRSGAIVELENKIQEIGILYEYWTITADRPRTIIEPHTYRTGVDAVTLQESITELVPKLEHANFGWVIISGGIAVYILGGAVSEKSASITITHIVSFIPNNFPFVYIDDVARAVEEPLPVRVMNHPLTEEWRSSVPNSLFLDEPPEEELAKEPPASLIGYLGPKPEPKRPDIPIRTKGLVALSIDCNRRFDFEDMVSEMDPVLCNFSTLPMRLNDLEEIKIVGHKAMAFLFPHYDFHNFHLILFDIDCDVNQHKALKL